MNEPINRCPYCMAPMEERPLERKLTYRQIPIYKAIVEAGVEGISNRDIMEQFLPGKSEGTLRSCIYSINQIINPQRLEGRGGRYYLSRVKWSEEPCDLPEVSE